MRKHETPEEAERRWEELAVLQEHYAQFHTFLEDVMTELGFTTTDIQKDIGAFMEHGPQYLMVQAQRGQAKTTIAAAFAVWCLIHSPAHRVLIISAGGTQANEISTLIVRIILTMDELECMRPDKLAGDRTATDAFDLHHSLKGLEKSPSVACVGIDSNLQGKRADLLIADDIESAKNSATVVQRAKLLNLTRDFTSICSVGRILWLGTPQTMDSIYNSLLSRGVVVRIWPGRYPTSEQVAFYGNRLAPLLVRRIAAHPELQKGGGLMGDQGQAIDPVLLDETTLVAKERDQGPAYFQLQHMLNTKMSDANRYPLKPELLCVVRGAGRLFPKLIVRGMENSFDREVCIAGHTFVVRTPQTTSKETESIRTVVAYIDPAAGGANGDETAWAIGGMLDGKVILLSWGGMYGGYEDYKLTALAQHLAKFKPDLVKIEKNMGYGAFSAVFTPIIRQHFIAGVEDDMVGALLKERRIIETLAPVMGRGSLIIDENVLIEDAATVEGYSPAMQQTYSGFFQLAKMTAVKDALIHDDRADALAGLVDHFRPALKVDQEKEIAAAREAELKKLREDPLGHLRNTFRGAGNSVSVSMIGRFFRR